MNLIFAIHRFGFHTLPTPAALSRLLPILWRGQLGITGHVVCHVPQADLGPDAYGTNTAHQRATGTHCHDSKYVFNSATYSRPTPISLLFSGCKFLVPASFALDMFAKSLFLQLAQRFLRTIRRISPYIFAGIT